MGDRFSVALNLLILVGVLWICKRISWYLLAAGIMIFSGTRIVRMVPVVMEWPLALLASVVFFALFYHALRTMLRDGGSPKQKAGNLIALVIAGFLGSLSRTEFLGVPLALGLASLLGVLVCKRWRMTWPAIGGFIGAVAGLATELLHNWYSVGTFLQDSAAVKAFWARRASWRSLLLPHRLALGVFMPGSGNISTKSFAIYESLLLASVAVFIWTQRRRLLSFATATMKSPVDLTMLPGGALAVAGFAALYSSTRAYEIWYSSLIVAPGVIVLAYVLGGVSQLARQSALPLIVTLAAVFVGINAAEVMTMAEPELQQRDMYLAGRILHEVFPARRCAAWNAGIINYYQGGSVVNLDGLMNHDVYPYLVRGQLEDYLRKTHIELLVDFKQWFEDPKTQARGGYDARLLEESEAIVAWNCMLGNTIFSEMQIRRMRENSSTLKKGAPLSVAPLARTARG